MFYFFYFLLYSIFIFSFFLLYLIHFDSLNISILYFYVILNVFFKYKINIFIFHPITFLICFIFVICFISKLNGQMSLFFMNGIIGSWFLCLFLKHCFGKNDLKNFFQVNLLLFYIFGDDQRHIYLKIFISILIFINL